MAIVTIKKIPQRTPGRNRLLEDLDPNFKIKGELSECGWWCRIHVSQIKLAGLSPYLLNTPVNGYYMLNRYVVVVH